MPVINRINSLIPLLFRFLRLNCLLAMLTLSLAFADEQAIYRTPVEDGLKGMNAEQIERRYGEPDRKQSESEEREVWNYGRSIIILESGMVTAWSNAGELRERRNVAALKPDEKVPEETGFASKTWSNPWTPQDPVGADDVVLELMEEDSDR